jgi:hypothetical protein
MELTALQSVVCIVVSALLGYAVPTDASPFRADRDGLSSIPSPVIVKMPGSSSRELGSPPEFVVPTSARASEPCLHTTHDHGRLPWGSSTSSRHQHRESTSGGRPEPTSVPPSAFHTLSTACSSQCLAGLFHPAATSRFRASGVSSLEPAAPPRRWPLPPRRWRRPPVIGCPMTPANVASTSRS